MSNRDLSLFGISDTELLAIVDDLVDEDGWTHSVDVRTQLGENLDDKRSGVGPRLGWMVRYGWLERGKYVSKDKHANATYRLTAVGSLILEHPELSASAQKALDKANPAQRIKMVRQLGEEATDGSMEVHSALRRQFRRSMRR